MPGGDVVHVDVIERERPREVAQSALGRVVRCRPGHRDLLVHRGDVDDLAAAAMGAAHADEFAAAVERAVQVGLERVVPILERHVGHLFSRAVDAGVVHEDVGRGQAPRRFAEQLLHLLRIVLIDLQHDRAAPPLLHGSARALRALAVVQVGDRHVGAFLGESLGHRLSDAGIRRRDSLPVHCAPGCGSGAGPTPQAPALRRRWPTTARHGAEPGEEKNNKENRPPGRKPVWHADLSSRRRRATTRLRG